MEDNDTVEITVNKTGLKRDIAKLITVALTGFAAERFAGALFDRMTKTKTDVPTIDIDSE